MVIDQIAILHHRHLQAALASFFCNHNNCSKSVHEPEIFFKMEEWPSCPLLILRGNVPTTESALSLLQNMLVENGEVIAYSKFIINKYIDHYGMVDRPYNLSSNLTGKPLKGKTGCRSAYHSSPCTQKAIWSRSFCADCELLEYNWERAAWPRISVLHRHLSDDLCTKLKQQLTSALYWRLTGLLFGGVIEYKLDNLVLRYAKTDISPRALVPIVGCKAARDVQNLRRLKQFDYLRQRVTSLVSFGWAMAKDFKIRKGAHFGIILHKIGPFIFTNTYYRIINIALTEPFVLKLASPMKSPESAECLTHEEILNLLINRQPIIGSIEVCTRGNFTKLDTRGSIFIDLIHCAAHNTSASLAPIDALHFSPDPDHQAILKKERAQPWKIVQKPTPALVALIEVRNKEKRQR